MQRKELAERLNQAGISLFGVAPMPAEEFLLQCRAKSKIPEGAKSVIVCLFPYYSPELEQGNISQYAMVEDYHKVVGSYLSRACELLSQVGGKFVPFVDNSPIPEVSIALQAGLGKQGKNGLLITKQYGTYQFIGEIVTDQLLEYDVSSKAFCCGCGRCETACPGKAIQHGKIRLEQCASHINQLKRDLTEQEQQLVKDCGLVWGCDICQKVCPHNQNIQTTTIPEFLRPPVCSVSWETIPKLVQTRAFGFRGPKPLLRNYQLLYPESCIK
ncbi:epoxyqueuosine reductase [Massilioclostridium coli]|uniref:epoxyqueuosine reductase n=1 Tax=Massilioclostridium coli TaxID=1870991 RepID=UPI00085C4B0F|nr:QueG-associated DUF1730 domain-containing protein [Massilioclostridium coli]